MDKENAGIKNRIDRMPVVQFETGYKYKVFLSSYDKTREISVGTVFKEALKEGMKFFLWKGVIWAVVDSQTEGRGYFATDRTLADMKWSSND